MKTVTGLREEKGAAQNTPRRRLLRALKRAVLVVVCVYVLLLAVLYFAQRRLIFHAASTRRGAGAQAVPPPGVEKVSFRTAQGDPIVGFFGRALTPNGLPDRAAAHRQTLLFFCGKGECVAACRPQMQAFRRLGLNVLIPDYPGFGMSRGRESEAGCYATADAAYTYLCRRPGIDPKRIVVSGFSLGSAVAIDLTARRLAVGQPIMGLAVFSAFTSLPDEAHDQYPIYPTPLLWRLIKYPFASLQKMPRVTCPVFLASSRADRRVPFWMSARMAAACAGPVTPLVIQNAVHGSVLAVDGSTLYPALGRWLAHLR